MKHLQSDPATHESLLRQADQFCAELLAHPVLSHYRDNISIVLKGSAAHGYSDRYSDVDLVVFAHQDIRQKIIDDYIRQKLSQRKDGVFLPLHDWAGHYNIDSYEDLAKICDQDSAEYLWEYSGSKILHDPQEIFASTVKSKLEDFQKKLPVVTKAKYIECQLYLDWLRQPLRRADYAASFLYTSSVYSSFCQILFLLQEKTYPCQKWLPYYFSQLNISNSLKQKIEGLPLLFAQMQNDFCPGLDLMEYSVYRQGFEIVEEIKELLKEKYGNLQWIEEWYLYA